MEFKSKTALHEHFHQLEELGYVTSEWILRSVGKKTKATRYYKINFNKFKQKVNAVKS